MQSSRSRPLCSARLSEALLPPRVPIGSSDSTCATRRRSSLPEWNGSSGHRRHGRTSKRTFGGWKHVFGGAVWRTTAFGVRDHHRGLLEGRAHPARHGIVRRKWNRRSAASRQSSGSRCSLNRARARVSTFPREAARRERGHQARCRREGALRKGEASDSKSVPGTATSLVTTVSVGALLQARAAAARICSCSFGHQRCVRRQAFGR